MQFYSFPQLVVQGISRYLGSGLSPDDYSQRYPTESHSNPGAFVDYGKLALLDPKAPLELKALGPTLWVATNIIPVTFLMWHIDPLNFRPGEGLDESYYMWPDVQSRVDRLMDPVDDFFAAPPSFWELY